VATGTLCAMTARRCVFAESKSLHEMRPLFVIDDIRSPRRTFLFTMAGVRIEATRHAWMAPITWLVFGLLIAALDGDRGSVVSVVAKAAVYAAALYLANVLHSIGHIVGGRIVGAPMDILLLTSTRDVTLYLTDPSTYPVGVRVGRSLSGPAANIVVALLCFSMTAPLRAAWLESVAVVNLAVGLWTLCPIPTMDGWVIWRSLFRGRSRE
jgi:Zn-dependent protease